MLEELIELDKSIFLNLNGLRSDWADTFMWWFSQSVTWIPVAVILAAVIIATPILIICAVRRRKKHKKG